MSLILDALNRAEDERRSGGSVPGLDTQHYPAPESGRRFGLRAALPALAMLLGAVLVWWVLSEGDATAPEAVLTQESAPMPPVSRPGPEAEPVRTSQAVKPPPPEAASSQPPVALSATARASRLEQAQVAALYQRQPIEGPQLIERDARVATRPAPTAKQSRNEPSGAPAASRASDTPQRSEVVEASAAPEQAIDLEKMIAIAEREIENQRLAEHPAPFLTDLSQQRKDAIPTLMYSRHNFGGDSGRSTIVINGKTLRAGAQVLPGIRLEEILPDSAVFSFRGEQFRLAALNSWVNL
ncbi:MAG: general secretion pathway protein GspB [Pseudomonadota bacterium]